MSETPKVSEDMDRSGDFVRESRGWHSRGYLPHFDQGEVIQHVTFRLADSLPGKVMDFLEGEIRGLPPEKQDVERRKRMEAGIDAGHGSCVLREPSVAEMVQNALLFFDGQRYRLLAWVVMPNHVHVLFHPMAGWTIARIVASWKKFTAARICTFRRSNLSQTGVAVPGSVVPGTANLPIGAVKAAGGADKSSGVVPETANLPIGAIKTSGGVQEGEHVWYLEYWDRFIRDSRHFEQVVAYIHQNPVKAGLVAQAEDWPWSSAGRGKGPILGTST
jgi:REP element-mobilizing transposase RayT